MAEQNTEQTTEQNTSTLNPPSEHLKTVSGALVQVEEMLMKSEELSRTLQDQVNKANTSRIGLLAQKALLVEMKKKFEILENPIKVRMSPIQTNITPIAAV